MLLGAVVPVADTPLPVRFAEIKDAGQNARATGRAVAPQPPPQVTITITIGRVEIRAAALPVQPIAPVVSGPPLSLETYLRRGASRTA